MKGYVYYSKEGSVKNKLFIDELLKKAKQNDIELRLLLGNEQPDTDVDFILFRDRNLELARKFEASGIHLFNRAEVNRIANNKLRTFELATLLGVPSVPTKRIQSIEDIESYPVVIKTVDGHAGSEVYLCSTPDKAKIIFKKFEGRELIAQPYIESGAQDVRVFVLGQDIVGAVKRTGNDSFKSNYSLGGTIEKYSLSSSQEKHALKIAKAIKSDYIGIDFLLLPDGSWLLNEIEDPVGARSFYKTHDFSIAEKLIEYIKKTIESPYK